MHNGIVLSHKEASYDICKQRMKLEIIILSRINQTQEDKHCMFSYICEINS